MTYAVSVEQVIALHQMMIDRYGGDPGIRDRGLVESSVAQPMMTFGGTDLYPTLIEKAVALGFSLIRNHGFVDGNKRVGFAALDAFLLAHGKKVLSTLDDMESAGLAVAVGTMTRTRFLEWVRLHLVDADTPPI